MSRSSTIQLESVRLIQKMQLPESFVSIVNNIYLPLAEIIIYKNQAEPLFVSINGAQGTGKSTLTQFLKHLIEAESGLSVAAISLDDYYLTRAERIQLSKDVHPLFATRGVPGTHDLDLMTNTISALREKQACIIPRFDKAMDERCNDSMWTQYNSQPKKTVDIILFEGWCNHSPPQTDEELIKPINKLEELEDSSAIWRSYANDQLKNYQQKIFNHADMNIMLKAPDFNCIYEWRSLQEEKLRKTNSNNKNLQIMSKSDLNRFIQHYERISHHTLKHLPTTADIVIPIFNDHSINEILIKKSS